MNDVFTIIVLALAVATISLIISKAGIMRPLREWVQQRNARIGEMVQCPFCISFWISLLTVVIYQPVLVSCGFKPADLAVSVFVMMAVASPAAAIISFSVISMMDEGHEE